MLDLLPSLASISAKRGKISNGMRGVSCHQLLARPGKLRKRSMVVEALTLGTRVDTPLAKTAPSPTPIGPRSGKDERTQHYSESFSRLAIGAYSARLALSRDGQRKLSPFGRGEILEVPSAHELTTEGRADLSLFRASVIETNGLSDQQEALSPEEDL